MGYTHYWRQGNKPTDEQWDSITSTFKKAMTVALVTGKPFPIQREQDISSPPEIDEENIVFNGIGEAAHETMYLERNGRDFNFCKTNRKPYDFVAMVLLVLVDHFASDCWDVSSDGVRDEWKPAVDWLNASGLGQFSLPKGI